MLSPPHPGSLPPERIHDLDSLGVRLRLSEWGDPAAPPVLLHGIFDHGLGFDTLAPLPAERLRVVALAVAPVLVLLSYVIGPTPMDLQFWPGAVLMVFLATMTASLVTNSGRSTWFVGVLILMVYAIFATTLLLLPPRVP
jgi:hypothetical protein